MKKLIVVLMLLSLSNIVGQSNTELVQHYEAFYKQMLIQRDVNGVINALTHLNILEPSQARRDTLAYIYMDNNQHIQALNTIGIEKVANDSDLAVQVKAVSLKALNQPKRAIEQFQVMYDRNPNAIVAYELADLQIQTGALEGAATNIEYGIANSIDGMKHAFFERQQPYEVPLKAAFLHLKGLLSYNQNQDDIDGALKYIDEALTIDPNFNLASLSKQALESRKPENATEGN